MTESESLENTIARVIWGLRNGDCVELHGCSVEIVEGAIDAANKAECHDPMRRIVVYPAQAKHTVRR